MSSALKTGQARVTRVPLPTGVQQMPKSHRPASVQSLQTERAPVTAAYFPFAQPVTTATAPIA